MIVEWVNGFWLDCWLVTEVFLKFARKRSESSVFDEFDEILLLFPEEFLVKNIRFQSFKTSLLNNFVLQVQILCN
jgi:hypothetical protein